MKATLLGGAWMGGICLAYFGFDALPIVAIAAICAGAVAGLRLGRGWLAPAMLLLVLGAVRFGSTEPADLPALQEASVDFTAVVEDDARSAGPRASFTGRIEEASVLEWQGRSIVLEVPAFFQVEYGDLAAVSGTITPLESSDPAEHYLIEGGIVGRLSYPERFEVLGGGHGSWWRQPLVELREWASGRMDSLLPEPVSGLARGMVLGERADIDRDLREDLSDAGISHLIAISGQNVVLLAGLVTAMATPLAGRRWAAAFALAAIGAYAAFLGAPAAILRASLMGSLFVLAPVLGRQSGGAGALLLSGSVLTALDPQIVRNLSFQLSYAAVGGLILLSGSIAGNLSSLLDNRRLPAPPALIDTISVTTAAWLATMPIVAINFDKVSVAGFAANALVAPMFVPMLVSALVTIPASYLPDAIQFVVSWPAWIFFGYFKEVGALAAARIAVVDVSGFTSLYAIPVYCALLLGGWVLARNRAAEVIERPVVLRPGPAIFVPTLCLLNLLIWPAMVDGSDGRLLVSFLDVGQGDAVFIETPAGERILVDGGPDPARLVRELDDQLGFGSRELDLVLLSHMDSDHAAGIIAVLERYDVKRVAWNGINDGSVLARQWLEAVEESEAELTNLGTGDQILLQDARLSVLWPQQSLGETSDNEGSLVVRISYGETDVLLTGDIGTESEVALLASRAELGAEVLKVAHHGSAGSSLLEFLLAVDPQFAVIQSGASNPFGHPSEQALSRLDEAGSIVLRNDLHGTVTLVSDGDTVWRE